MSLLKFLGYTKCYSSSSPILITSPSDTTARRYSWLRRPKLNWKSQKRQHFSGDQQAYYLPVFSRTLLTMERRLTKQ